jgi:hypothetical protein
MPGHTLNSYLHMLLGRTMADRELARMAAAIKNGATPAGFLNRTYAMRITRDQDECLKILFAKAIADQIMPDPPQPVKSPEIIMGYDRETVYTVSTTDREEHLRHVKAIDMAMFIHDLREMMYNEQFPASWAEKINQSLADHSIDMDELLT